MDNVLKIFDRLTLESVKKRTFLLLFIFQNIILSLVVLVYANIIISNARINNELDYQQIQNFYTISIALLFFSIYILAPLVLSNWLNKLYKSNIIEHLLSVDIDISSIVFAVFLRGISIVSILLISAMPIISISFYFGGFSIIKVIKLIICLFAFILLLSSTSIYISTIILDGNLSIVVAYVIGLFIYILNIINLSRILNSTYFLIFYLIFIVITSLVLLYYARKTKIFMV